MMNIEEKQPKVYQFLSKTIEKDKLVHAYLFEGENGTGKYELAIWLAQCYFCEETLLACGTCSNCQRILSGDFPDLHKIQPDGQSIKIDQILQIKHHLGKSGLENAKQFLIVQESDKLTIQAANSLLKFIEEPEGPLKIVFLTENRERVITTIQSRCQLIHLDPISKKNLKDSLVGTGVTTELATILSGLTNDYQEAMELSQDEGFVELKELVEKWLHYLLKKDPYGFVFVQQYFIKHCREKVQQEQLYDILVVYLQIFLTSQHGDSFKEVTNWSKNKLAMVIEDALTSKNNWRSNVPFQVTLEQFVLKVLRK